MAEARGEAKAVANRLFFLIACSARARIQILIVSLEFGSRLYSCTTWFLRTLDFGLFVGGLRGRAMSEITGAHYARDYVLRTHLALGGAKALGALALFLFVLSEPV